MMSRIVSLALIFAGAATAADYPASAGYVNDFTGTIPDAVQQALERRLRAYERATSNEVAVAIVPSLQGETVEQFAKGMFRAWSLGKSEKNNGVLFLWATSERQVRIQVGYGLESILTDRVCADILSRVTALLMESRNSEAVQAAVDGILQRLSDVAPPVRDTVNSGSPENSGGSHGIPQAILLAGIAAFAIGVGVIHHHTTRTHELQVEVPAAIARAGELLQATASESAQASAGLNALREDAPREVWDGFQKSVAEAPENLRRLRLELDSLQRQRREEYRELKSASHALRRWQQEFEQTTAVFAAVRNTQQQFYESRKQVVEQIPRLSESLSSLTGRVAEAGSSERHQSLLSAAQSNFDTVNVLRAHPPVNWLLARDLLDDAQACVDCLCILLEPGAGESEMRNTVLSPRAQRFWSGSDADSAASAQLASLAAIWSSQSATTINPPAPATE